MFDYTWVHEAASTARGRGAGVPGHPVTEVVAGSLADRRRRAVTKRCATLGVAERPAVEAGPAGVDPADPTLAALVVLLPSTDAATVLLLCSQAAELTR